MADGRDTKPAFNLRTLFPWFDIFRCFQVALDLRNLFVAAAGIFAMSLSWWLLSNIFWYKAPNRSADEYSIIAVQKSIGIKKPGTDLNYTQEDYIKRGDEKFIADLEQWKVLDSLAGPNGKLRSLPWNEYHGQNPFLFVTDVVSGSYHDPVEAIRKYISELAPVLVEPMFKLLLPIAKLISPGVSP
ncbi:MAG TPA: hypothetical protein VG097_18145, partial [Gemmata sp.]|nr:hypothetical protein [Gemmata sp.]